MCSEVDEVVARLAEAIPEEQRDAFVDALEVAYEDAADRFDPGVGSNGSTFGTDVYHFSCFQVRKAIDARELGEMVSFMPAFRASFGAVRMGCHRVGDSLSRTIEQCFPASEYAGETLTTQLDLFSTRGRDAPIGLVLAHRGNPDDGLLSVHLCVPGGVGEDGQINSWAVAIPLWTRGVDDKTLEELEVTLPPAEPVSRPAVVRKSKKK